MVNKIGVKEKKLYENKRSEVKVEFKVSGQNVKSILLCLRAKLKGEVLVSAL